jgi:hypothetical protein
MIPNIIHSLVVCDKKSIHNYARRKDTQFHNAQNHHCQERQPVLSIRKQENNLDRGCYVE